MELTRLESFVAVAEELNFGRGAERVHLTASPVSRAIKELERDVGGALFLREYHHIELTPLGRELLPLARQVLADTELLKARARRLTRARPKPVLKLGVSKLCPPVAGEAVEDLFLKAVPGGLVEVTVASAADLLPQVESGDLSVALVQLPVGRLRLSTKVLAKLTTWVIMRNDDPLASHEGLCLDDLAGHTLIIGSSHVEPVAMDTMIANLRAHGVVNLVEMPDFDHVKLAWHIRHRGGLALTLHPRTGGSARIFDDEAFRLVPLTDHDFRFYLGAVWRTADEQVEGPVRQIVDLLNTSWVAPDVC